MVWLKRVSFIGFFTMASFASNFKADQGQKDFEIYFDTGKALYEVNSLTGKVSWSDKAYLDDYFFHHSNRSLYGLQKFLSGEFHLALACSKSQLMEHYDYYRYAVRLLVLSYLYEINEDLNYHAKKMFFGSICSTNWKK